jgi:hypothetical protein
MVSPSGSMPRPRKRLEAQQEQEKAKVLVLAERLGCSIYLAAYLRSLNSKLEVIADAFDRGRMQKLPSRTRRRKWAATVPEISEAARPNHWAEALDFSVVLRKSSVRVVNGIVAFASQSSAKSDLSLQSGRLFW